MERRRLPLISVFIGLLTLSLALIASAAGSSVLVQVSAARGGAVKSPSGRLSLTIPPGTLEKDTIGQGSVAGKSGSHGTMAVPGFIAQSYFADPAYQGPIQYPAGPAYTPSDGLGLRFEKCHWKAGQFYSVPVVLATSVSGRPAAGGFPAAGGEVQWLGFLPRGTCFVRTLAVEV
jgi:hypothetical protein